MTKIHTVKLNDCELAIFKTFIHLTQQRAREPTVQKETAINAHSIAKNCDFTYEGVRKALKRLSTKL